MTNVLVTGSRGFIGRNLCTFLHQMENIHLMEFTPEQSREELEQMLSCADVIFHLAGVNRPQREEEFHAGNAGFTEEICSSLCLLQRSPRIIFTSSIQAELDNPYGKSKRLAEEILNRFSAQTGAECVAYRLKNLFGKWCRPNYNSVTATFCHNIARDMPITISDPDKIIELTYVDDVINAFVLETKRFTEKEVPAFRYAPELCSYRITLGELAETLHSFRDVRSTLVVPDFEDPFVNALYATYLSYLEGQNCAYGLEVRADNRGSLAEFLKSPCMGQIFISRTKPGITRGNHYHHTKTEKFLVMEGAGVIRLRRIDGSEVIEHHVRGEEYRVVDIPPGYTHSIENIGTGEMVTLFWVNEIFDAERPDTYFEPVKLEG